VPAGVILNQSGVLNYLVDKLWPGVFNWDLHYA
jgi:hypothetical protein